MEEMSWFCLSSSCAEFGEDGYIRCLASESGDPKICCLPSERYSAGRISYNRCSPAGPTTGISRLTYRASQCADHDGPRWPPDILDGVYHASRSPEERSEKYNGLLALEADTMRLVVSTLLSLRNVGSSTLM